MPQRKKQKTAPRADRVDLVGRQDEFSRIEACLKARRNVLLEGPVGVGKTKLALAVTASLGVPVFRVDGDNRYTEQKLSGWFDPPTVIKKGFTKEAFIAGPLVEAMKKGGVLFINEMNRLSEGVQNVLLPAIDERMVFVPKLGRVDAVSGFMVVATQNPKEFVATSHLSEALLDRFELVVLDYQTEEEETDIVLGQLPSSDSKSLARAAVRITRLTRDYPRIKRGASIRAALSVAQIALVMMAEGVAFEKAFISAIMMALPTRIEIEREADSERTHRAEAEAILMELAQETLKNLDLDSSANQKKKT